MALARAVRERTCAPCADLKRTRRINAAVRGVTGAGRGVEVRARLVAEWRR